MRLDYRISYLLSVFKKEFVEVFPMQDSGADGTAPAFDSTSEPCFLPPPLSPATTAVCSSQPILSIPQMHSIVPLMPSVRSREGPFPSGEATMRIRGGTLPQWGSQDLTKVLVISHQELARVWASLGC